MILLKIREKGHFIEIPGLPALHTPVEIDISNFSLPLIASHLKNAGIQNYQIIAESDSASGVQRKVFTHEDFFPVKEKKPDKLHEYQKGVNKRLDKLEKLISSLAEKSVGNKDDSGEQISNKLDALADLIKEREAIREIVHIPSGQKIDEDEPDIEELMTFVPEVDIGGMEIKGSATKKIEKRDAETDDSADILSKLIDKRR